MSNNCGGTFTLATTTAEAVAPIRCAMPDLTANPPALSDQYGNATGGENDNVLGAGTITILGTVNNIGGAAVPGAFSNEYKSRPADGVWNSFQSAPLNPISSIGAGALNQSAGPYSWIGGVGTWDFRLTTDTSNAVVEENEENNISEPTTVEIVDYTPALTSSPTTVLAGDTITFTTSAERRGNVENPLAVAFSNPQCGADGTAVSSLTASTDNDTSVSFSCSYSTPGVKTSTVSSAIFTTH